MCCEERAAFVRQVVSGPGGLHPERRVNYVHLGILVAVWEMDQGVMGLRWDYKESWEQGGVSGGNHVRKKK